MLPIIVIFIIYIAYLVGKRKKLFKQVEVFDQLLYGERDPQKYINEVDKLLVKRQSEREMSINYIQKTTGLLYLGKFDEVINILNNKIKKIPSNWQVVYYHNMLLSLYFNGDIEKANEVLGEVRDTINQYYKKDYNKVTVELILAVSNFYNDKLDECKEFFKLLIDVTNNEYRIAMGYYFSAKILEYEGKDVESIEYLEKAQSIGQGLFIEHL